MAQSDGRVVIDTELNNKGFSKGVSNMQKQVSGLTSTVKKLGTAIASAFAVKELINFGKEAIELGSNIAEVQNVVDTAFGDMAYKVEAFSETAIQNFGMSRLAAKKTASTYMAMAKGMGLTEEMASDMSISLAGLTGDVASFYNISQEEADVKLKSIFTGESDALKSLGVVMSQTNLEAYALKKGITKEMDAMSQAELVALRYGFVTEALSLAQGDFAKTSDGWANQTRILSMQWEEFTSIIGQSLITVLTPLLKILNQLVSTLVSAATAFNAFISGVFGKEESAASSVTSEISESVGNQEALTEATEDTAKAQKKLLAGFDEINKIGGESKENAEEGGLAGIEVPAFTALAESTEAIEQSGALTIFEKLQNAVAPFRDAFMKAVEAVKSGAKRIKDAVLEIWDDIKTFAEPLIEWAKGPLVDLINQIIEFAGSTFGGILDSFGGVLSDLWNIILYPALQYLFTEVLPVLTDFASRVIGFLSGMFSDIKTMFDGSVSPVLVFFRDLWTSLWDYLSSVWTQYGAPIFEQIKTAVQNVADNVRTWWETIMIPVIEKLGEVIDKVWKSHIKPLWDNIVDFIAKLVSGALEIYNGFIAPIEKWFTEKFGGNIAEALQDIIQKIGNFVGVVADVASYIIDALKGVIDFVVGVFTGDWNRAWDGLVNVFKGTVNALLTLTESFVNYFVRAINKVITAANSLSFDLPDWIPGIGGQTFGLNIPTIREVKLPRLATGAVVPPNREFMAVLGDNKHETEVVSPLSTMKQAMIEALRESGSGSGTYTFVVNLDGREVARNQVKHINDMTRRAGKPVLLF